MEIARVINIFRKFGCKGETRKWVVFKEEYRGLRRLFGVFLFLFWVMKEKSMF